MGKMVGIDLGTTNSVVAIVDGPVPRVLENREARSQTRSVVGLRRRRSKGAENVEVLVGDAAMDNYEMAPKDTIISIKRLMGRGANDPEVQKVRYSGWGYEIVQPSDGTADSVRVVMGGQEYSPVDISALILTKLKEDAEYRLGEPVTHAVVTVPAYFSQIQRDATRKAALKAGLRVIKILDEPTAAAIAFGLDSGDATPKTVLVFDLGGGTFDISVLMSAGAVFAPLDLEGDMWLGGDNLDQQLAEHVLAQVREDYAIDPTTNLRFMAALKRAVQAAKERLTSAKATSILVTGMLQDGSGNLIDVDVEVTRDQFERMILPLVARYRQCACAQINYATDQSCARCGQALRNAPVMDGRTIQLIRTALANANVSPDQIDFVIMAGNASTVPLVQRTMEELFGPQRIRRNMHPKHSVAIGAAVVAALHGTQSVCQARDPGDPSRECGHVNVDDAKVCARCGAPLETEETKQRGEGEGMKLGAIGQIAPFSYGIQTVGDKFNVFIRKGDPFPTESPLAQIFRTVVARQRMISLPVYGGDNLDRASANEKQGDVFAVLPPDLPGGTPIRVKVWLNSDGVFDLSAHLDDGTDLRPWTVKGEQDAKVIKAIERVDKALGDRADDLGAEGKRELEQARNRMFERLRNHDYPAAEQEVARIEQVALQGPTVVKDSLRKRAQDLAAWCDWLIQQYGWALEPQYGRQVNELLQDLRTALAGGNERLIQDKFDALDKLTERVPGDAGVLLQIRGAIYNRIRVADPAKYAEFMRRLEDGENRLRRNDRSGVDVINTLYDDVGRAVQQLSAAAAGLRCSRGHDVPSGSRYCPTCNEDTWALDAGSGSAASRGFERTGG